MKKTLQLILLICFSLLTSQAMAQDKTTRNKPAYEQGDQSVTKDDLLILKRSDEILSDETKWNRKDTRVCKSEDKIWSLFCSLQKASIEVLGKYDHRRAALEEVRLVIEEVTKGKEFKHRLMDYNNLPSTQFEDIKKVLKTAAEKVAARLKDNK